MCTCGLWLDIIDAWSGNLTFENNASIYKSNDVFLSSNYINVPYDLTTDAPAIWRYIMFRMEWLLRMARVTLAHMQFIFLSLSSLLKKIAYISFSHIHFTIKSNGFRWVTLELFFSHQLLSQLVHLAWMVGKRQWKTQFLHNINNIFICNLFFVAVIYLLLLLPFLWYFFFFVTLQISLALR